MLRHAMLHPVRGRSVGRGVDSSDDGAVAVEFALVLPLLVLFLFGILQFGLFFFRMQGIQSVAIEASRGGAVGLTVEQIATRVKNTLNVPLAYADLDIEIVLTNTATSTEISRIDGKTTDPLLLATAPCRGIVDAEDHVLEVNLSVDPTLTEYQVVIPVWGSLRVNYGARGTFTCENTA